MASAAWDSWLGVLQVSVVVSLESRGLKTQNRLVGCICYSYIGVSYDLPPIAIKLHQLFLLLARSNMCFLSGEK